MYIYVLLFLTNYFFLPILVALLNGNRGKSVSKIFSRFCSVSLTGDKLSVQYKSIIHFKNRSLDAKLKNVTIFLLLSKPKLFVLADRVSIVVDGHGNSTPATFKQNQFLKLLNILEFQIGRLSLIKKTTKITCHNLTALFNEHLCMRLTNGRVAVSFLDKKCFQYTLLNRDTVAFAFDGNVSLRKITLHLHDPLFAKFTHNQLDFSSSTGSTTETDIYFAHAIVDLMFPHGRTQLNVCNIRKNSTMQFQIRGKYVCENALQFSAKVEISKRVTITNARLSVRTHTFKKSIAFVRSINIDDGCITHSPVHVLADSFFVAQGMNTLHYLLHDLKHLKGESSNVELKSSRSVFICFVCQDADSFLKLSATATVSLKLGENLSFQLKCSSLYARDLTDSHWKYFFKSKSTFEISKLQNVNVIVPNLTFFVNQNTLEKILDWSNNYSALLKNASECSCSRVTLVINEFEVTANYKPNTSDLLNVGRWNNRLCFLQNTPIENLKIRTKACRLVNTSTCVLKRKLLAFYFPLNKLVPTYIKGIQPVRVGLKIGSGIVKVVLLPTAQLVKGDSISSVHSDFVSNVRSLTVDCLTLGSRVTSLGYKALMKCDSLVESSDERSKRKREPTTSLCSNQPANVSQACSQARHVLEDHVTTAAKALIRSPAEAYQRRGLVAGSTKMAKGLTRSVVRPVAGVSVALNRLCYGIRNSVDPSMKKDADDCWK